MSLTFEKLNLIWSMNKQLNHTNMICKPLKFTENMRRTVPIHDKNPIPSKAMKLGNTFTPTNTCTPRESSSSFAKTFYFIEAKILYNTTHHTTKRERERERGKFEIGETKGMWFLGVTTNHLDLCKNAISGKWYISVGALWRAINDNFGLTPWTFVNPLICIKSHTPKQREILPFPYISSFTRNSSIISMFF